MRIAVVTSSFLPHVGGMEWKVHFLASEYVLRGHQATVFTGRTRWTGPEAPLPITPTYDVIRSGFSGPGMGRLGIVGLLWTRAILARHRRTPFDVIHCHPLGLSSQIGVRIKRLTGIPAIGTTSGGDILQDTARGIGLRSIGYIDRQVRESAAGLDLIASVSRATRTAIEAIQPHAPIVDIPNGVNWTEFQVPRTSRFRERLKIPPTALMVLSVGRNIPSKGFTVALAGFAKVHRNHPDAVYVLVGRDCPRLQDQVVSLGIADQTRLVDQVPMADLPEIFRAADVFLNPSVSEGFAQVNAQALASGLPLVVTDAPGNVDAADHGGALIVQTDNPDDIARALAALIENPPLRSQLAQQAHSAGKHYAWSRIADQYLALFEDLIRRRRTPD